MLTPRRSFPDAIYNRAMRVRGAALLLVLSAGCGGTNEAAPELSAIEPREAYNDEPVPITLIGGPFRPSLTISTSSGGASLTANPFAAFLIPISPGVKGAGIARLEWLDDRTLSAEIPRGIPDGLYDVQVRDPRGNTATLKAAFRCLGADLESPRITLDRPPPGSFITADSNVEVMITVDDGKGRLKRVAWTLSSFTLGRMTGVCPLPQPPNRVECRFPFRAPRSAQSVEPLDITIDVEDTAGQMVSEKARVQVAWKPIATSFSPMIGPSYGMTQLTVRGHGFVNATRVLMDGAPIEPGGGIFESDTLIRGWTVAHEPGVVEVKVQTGTGQSSAGSFEYVSSPIIREIFPSFGPESGGTMVTIVGSHFRPSTRIYVGAGLTRDEVTVTDLVSPNRIRGLMPPGKGVVSLFAVDLITGDGELRDAYTYLPESPPP